MFNIEKDKKEGQTFNTNTIIIKTNNFKSKNLIKPKKNNEDQQVVMPKAVEIDVQNMFEIY